VKGNHVARMHLFTMATLMVWESSWRRRYFSNKTNMTNAVRALQNRVQICGLAARTTTGTAGKAAKIRVTWSVFRCSENVLFVSKKGGINVF
jgi:hypothetical protein